MKKIVIISLFFTFYISLVIGQNFTGFWELETLFSQSIQVEEVEFTGVEGKQIILTPVELISSEQYNDWDGVTNITFEENNIAYIYSPGLKGRISTIYKIYENDITLNDGKKLSIVHLTFYQDNSFVFAINLTKITDNEYEFTYIIQAGTFGLPYNYKSKINYIGRMIKK